MDWGAVLGAGAIIPLLNAGIRLAVPTGLAAVGETLCQRAGVLNLSLEGMMLSGALGAFLGAHYSGELWVGVLAGDLTRVGAGVLAVHEGLDQVGEPVRRRREHPLGGLRGEDEHRDKCFEAGASVFLPKPFTRGEMLAAIREATGATA